MKKRVKKQAVNKKRLMLVVQALRESPSPDDFTMRQFGHNCGTPGCALGHYAHRRDLQKIFKLSDGGYLQRTAGLKDTQGIDDYAVLRHFGITYDQSMELFSGSAGCGNALTATEAANYIEKFVGELP